jgi:MarR family transcriptional regulator for hemolysin
VTDERKPDDNADLRAAGAVAPGYLANHAARVFNRLVDAQLRPHGMSLALLTPLLLLSRHGPMLQRDLVLHAAVAQPAMVALLAKLEAAGLVARVPDLKDKRAATINVTEAGEAMASLGRVALMDANLEGLVGFAPDEVTALSGLLQRLIDNLQRSRATKYQK